MASPSSAGDRGWTCELPHRDQTSSPGISYPGSNAGSQNVSESMEAYSQPVVYPPTPADSQANIPVEMITGSFLQDDFGSQAQDANSQSVQRIQAPQSPRPGTPDESQLFRIPVVLLRSTQGKVSAKWNQLSSQGGSPSRPRKTGGKSQPVPMSPDSGRIAGGIIRDGPFMPSAAPSPRRKPTSTFNKQPTPSSSNVPFQKQHTEDTVMQDIGSPPFTQQSTASTITPSPKPKKHARTHLDHLQEMASNDPTLYTAERDCSCSEHTDEDEIPDIHPPPTALQISTVQSRREARLANNTSIMERILSDNVTHRIKLFTAHRRDTERSIRGATPATHKGNPHTRALRGSGLEFVDEMRRAMECVRNVAAENCEILRRMEVEYCLGGNLGEWGKDWESEEIQGSQGGDSEPAGKGKTRAKKRCVGKGVRGHGSSTETKGAGKEDTKQERNKNVEMEMGGEGKDDDRDSQGSTSSKGTVRLCR